MQPNRKAQVIALAVLLAASGAGIARKAGWRRRDSAPQEPQDAVYAMLDAARAGRISAYLASYTGQLETSLRQTAAETGDAAFAKYLTAINSAIKGVAVYDPETINPTQARLRVEYIYQDRNETQSVYLERISGAWKISRVDGDQRIKTLIPYGTRVNKQQPAANRRP